MFKCNKERKKMLSKQNGISFSWSKIIYGIIFTAGGGVNCHAAISPHSYTNWLPNYRQKRKKSNEIVFVDKIIKKGADF